MLRLKLLIFSFFSAALLANDTSLIDGLILERKEFFEEKNYLIIPYFQQDLIFPGLGAIFQYRNKGSNFGFEVDAGISSIYWINLVKKSISGVYFFKDSGHQISMGFGSMGMTVIDSKDEDSSFMVPLAYSHRSKDHFFTRLGVHAFYDSDKEVVFLPFLSFGYAF
jgi:hypothetical protein